MKTWKLFWDVGAVVVGLLCFWQVFTYFGRTIPGFGYFPLGVIFGVLGLGIGAVVTHLLEGLLGAILYKVFRVRVHKRLMFE